MDDFAELAEQIKTALMSVELPEGWSHEGRGYVEAGGCWYFSAAEDGRERWATVYGGSSDGAYATVYNGPKVGSRWVSRRAATAVEAIAAAASRVAGGPTCDVCDRPGALKRVNMTTGDPEDSYAPGRLCEGCRNTPVEPPEALPGASGVSGGGEVQ